LLRQPKLISLTVAVSLSQIGEFSFILASLGVEMKVLSGDARDLILAGALLSIIANPILFALLDRWEKRQIADEVPMVDDAVPLPETVTDHAVVVGYGRVGSQLAHLLHERGVPVVVIEEDGDRVAHAREDGLYAVRGNAASERVMREAAPERAKLAVFAIPQALEAGEAIVRLKAINPYITVLARAHSDTEVRHLLEHGADATVLAERELAYSLAEMVMATPPYRHLRTGAT